MPSRSRARKNMKAYCEKQDCAGDVQRNKIGGLALHLTKYTKTKNPEQLKAALGSDEIKVAKALFRIVR